MSVANARRRLATMDFVPFSQIFTGEGDGFVAVPFDSTSVTFKVWGPGGGGSRTNGSVGFGGGAGAYAERTVVVDPADWGNIIYWRIYPAGQGRKGSTGNGSSPYAGLNGAGVTGDDLSNWGDGINVHQGYSATTSAPGGASTGSNDPAGTVTAGAAAFSFQGADAPGGALGGNTPGKKGAAPGAGGAGGFISGGNQSDGGDGGDGRVEIHWS